MTNSKKASIIARFSAKGQLLAALLHFAEVTAQSIYILAQNKALSHGDWEHIIYMWPFEYESNAVLG